MCEALNFSIGEPVQSPQHLRSHRGTQDTFNDTSVSFTICCIKIILKKKYERLVQDNSG